MDPLAYITLLFSDDLVQLCVDYLKEYPLLVGVCVALPVLLCLAFFFLMRSEEPKPRKSKKKKSKDKEENGEELGKKKKSKKENKILLLDRKFAQTEINFFCLTDHN